MIITSLTEADTIKAATEFAATLRPGDTILLTGDLGAGKSVFCRAIIRTLTGQPELEVPSPTYTLIQAYDTPAAPIWHFDLYRLKTPDEIFELGWEDAQAGGICLIEWPDRLGPYTPRKVRRVAITQQGDTRLIDFEDAA